MFTLPNRGRTLGFAAAILLSGMLGVAAFLWAIPASGVTDDPAGDTLAIWARDEVDLAKTSEVLSAVGSVDIVTTEASAGSPPSIRVGASATTTADIRLIGDRIRLQAKSSIAGPAWYNDIRGNGVHSGESSTPLVTPVDVDDEPAFRTGTADTQRVKVRQGLTETITPGAYGDLVVAAGATLVLDGGGDYEVQSIRLRADATLRVSAHTPVAVLVSESISTSQDASIEIADTAIVDAANVTFYVEGVGAAEGKGVKLNRRNHFEGILFAQMNGPGIEVKKDSTIFGALYGTTVELGERSTLTAVVGTELPAAADLSVTKTDDADPAAPGATVRYTIEVTNAGPATATDVVATDTLPAGVTLVSTAGCTEDPAAVPTCSLGSLVPGATASAVFEVTIDAGAAGTLTNNVSVSAAEADPAPFNNTTTETTTVGAPTDALADAYSSAGNVGITVPTASGLLSNDLGTALAVTGFDATSANNGSVAVALDGSFTYDPPAGFTGVDSFSYTAAGPGGGDSATVTITVEDQYWFIDSAGAPGDGTLQTPFDSIGAFAAANGGGAAAPGEGDVIFLAHAAASYSGPATLLANQLLIGEGATAPITSIAGTTLPPFSNPVPNTGGTRPTIDDSTAATTLTVASGTTVRGIDIANSAGGVGVDGTALSSVTIDELGVTSIGSAAIDLDGGVQDISIDKIDVDASGSGGAEFTNAATGSVFDLSGIDIFTSAGAGLVLGGDGTLTVGGATNDITSAGAEAFSLTGIELSATGATFRKIESSAGSLGMQLVNTGSGPFTVTGTGSTVGSGGTFSAISGDAVRLQNTGGLITLENMQWLNIGSTTGVFDTRSGHDGIHGENVLGGLSIDNAFVDNISDNFINGAAVADGLSPTAFVGLMVKNSTITDTNRFHVANVADGVAEGSIRLVGISGAVTITDNTFARSAEFLDLFSATTGSLVVTVEGNSFTDAYQEYTSGGTAKVGKLCIDITTRGSTSVSASIGGAGGKANTLTNCSIASLRIASESGAVTGPLTAEIVGNSFLVTDHSSTLGTSGNFPQGGVLLRHQGSGAFDARVIDNDFGAWDGATTSNWVMNADGTVGALSILAEGGAMQVESTGNEFNSPINSPYFVRADGLGTDAEVFFHDNTYRSQLSFFSPDPFFGTFTGPGLAHTVTAQNSADLDFVMMDEALGVHDVAFDVQDTVQIRAQSSSTLCASLTNVTTDIAGAHGDINTINSGATLNRHDGGGNDPFQTTGVVGTVGGCTTPTFPG